MGALTRLFPATVAGFAVAAGCNGNGNSEGPEPSTDAGLETSATVDVGVPIDAAPPLAIGDPCRGLPLPSSEHYVAPRNCVRLVATNLGQVRQISFAPDGDLFTTSIDGTIRRLRDVDGDGVFQDKEVVIFGNTGGNGNNCAIDSTGGFLYAGTPTGVSRWSWPGGPDGGGSPDPVVVNEPNTGHPYHTVHVYDGFLYVHSGSLGNEEDSSSPAYDDNRALLRRFDLSRLDPATPLDWTTGEVVAVGLRNMVGYTRNAAGRIYGVVNGIDGVTYQAQDVHEDNPGEQVVLVAPGKRYGYPFCYTAQRIVANGQLIPAGTQVYNEGFASGLNDAWCAANSDPPVTFLQAHSAPLDILFFDTQPQGALAERWRGGAFITMHGSAYRTQPTGYKVVWMPFNADGSAAMPVSTATSTTFPYEVVFGGGTSSGPVDGRWNWSTSTVPGEVPSPVGVAIGPIDGALYISSNAGGYLYRVGLGKD